MSPVGFSQANDRLVSDLYMNLITKTFRQRALLTAQENYVSLLYLVALARQPNIVVIKLLLRLNHYSLLFAARLVCPRYWRSVNRFI